MEENLYNTFDKTLYRRGKPLYQGAGKMLTDIGVIPSDGIGSGYSAGNIEMVEGNLQSGDFVTGVRGWQIDSDGNVEFNDGIFRGDVVLGGTIRTVNTAAEIQTAIDAVSAAGGGAVYLAPGTYLMTSDINVPSYVSLIGASINSCILDFQNGAYSVKSVGTIGNRYVNVRLKDILIKNSSTNGIFFQYSDQGVLDGVYVYTCGGVGIYLDNCSATGLIGSGGFTDGCNIGIKQTNCDACSIYFTTCINSTSHGLVLNTVNGQTIFDSAFNDNGGDGINATSIFFIAFASIETTGNTGQGVELVSGCNDNQFMAVMLCTNTSDGIRFTATSDRNQLVACPVTGNGGYGVNIVAATCDNNQIIAPAFDSNISGTIFDGGTNTFVSPQTFSGSIVRTYNLADSPATWTKLTNLKYIDVQLWAGGGSGGSHTTGGGGGGGGAYLRNSFAAAALGSTETVTVGSGGTAVTNSNGNTGGNSSFGSLITVYGGAGGNNSIGGGGGGIRAVGTVAGAGGSPIGGASANPGGSSNFGGGGGGSAVASAPGGESVYGGGGGGGTNGTGGIGGNSFYGGGGGGGGDGAGKAGGTSIFGGNGGTSGDASPTPTGGSVPAGGGGASNVNTTASGAGGAGRVIVTEFY